MTSGTWPGVGRDVVRRAGARRGDPWLDGLRLASARRLTVSLTLILLAGTVVMTGCGGKGATSDGKGSRAVAGATKTGPAATKYACPMDPEITSDQPGRRCPKCGMFLQPVIDGPAAGAEPSDAGKAEGDTGARDAARKTIAAEKVSGKQLYICPMHPTYVSDHPGDCPICGMRLVPAEQVTAGLEGAGLPGMAAIRLTTEGIRLAGVQTATVEHGSVARTIRTVGIVAADESRVRRVEVKVEGYVERLFVNTPGQTVRQDDPLLAIYSPDLLAGQVEYLRAIEARKSLGAVVGASGELSAGGTLPRGQDRLRDADLLVRAARERLQLLDVPDVVLEQLERTGKPTRTITLRSPVAGVVTERMAYEGTKVMPGMELFTITDLSEIWIEGSFYESEAPLVAVGRRATLTLAYDPSVTLQGTVRFVYPYLDPESRTLRARFSFPNELRVLKPGMYANVTMEVEADDGLLIPDNAVMDTGERKIVFVSRGDGLFEPRSVETGLHGGGMVQVLAGVMAGEEVVVRANFLLDSESRIRAALSGNAPVPAAGHEKHAEGRTGPTDLPGETAPPAEATGDGTDRGGHQPGGN